MTVKHDDSVKYMIGELEYIAQLFHKRADKAEKEVSVGCLPWNDPAPGCWARAAKDLETLSRRMKRELIED